MTIVQFVTEFLGTFSHLTSMSKYELPIWLGGMAAVSGAGGAILLIRRQFMAMLLLMLVAVIFLALSFASEKTTAVYDAYTSLFG